MSALWTCAGDGARPGADSSWRAVRATTPSMSREIGIGFAGRAGVHRVRNFAEELSLKLTSEGSLGQLSMDDADAAMALVRVTQVPATKLTRSLKLVNELLRFHHLSNEADVTVTVAEDQ